MPGDFFDSNTLLYLASGDDIAKADRAETLLMAGGVISVQVLNEITNVGRRKMRLDWPCLHNFLQTIRSILRVVPVTTDTHEVGLALAERYGLSTYDAMIVAAAQLEGCDRVWSEDMQHGLQIDAGPHIVNPFRFV